MQKKSALLCFLSGFVALGGLAHWMLREDEAVAPPPSVAADVNTNTIAHQWQWQNFADTEAVADAAGNSREQRPAVTGEVPSHVVGIYRILQSIRLDESGRVVPDQTLKEALEEGFAALGPDLSPAAMAEVQTLIRAGLPGDSGDETARILENYYRFRVAEAEFNAQPVSQLPADHYEELVQLRRSYLGAEVSDDLFAMEDTHGRHMFAAIAVQTNTRLTADEKQAQLGALQEKLNDRLLARGLMDPQEVATEKVQRLREQGASSTDIYSTRTAILGAEGASDLAAADREEAKWQSRFNGFWQARRYVMQAGLDEAERERQVEQLLDQYFSPEERERARMTSLDWLARNSK